MSKIDYKCKKCGAEGVKLWRQYNTCLVYIEEMCAFCALKDQGLVVPLSEFNEYGGHHDGLQMTNKVGNLMPAVPTEEMDTYWGYSSVPEDRWRWWQSLPLLQEAS